MDTGIAFLNNMISYDVILGLFVLLYIGTSFSQHRHKGYAKGLHSCETLSLFRRSPKDLDGRTEDATTSLKQQQQTTEEGRNLLRLNYSFHAGVTLPQKSTRKKLLLRPLIPLRPAQLTIVNNHRTLDCVKKGRPGYSVGGKNHQKIDGAPSTITSGLIMGTFSRHPVLLRSTRHHSMAKKSASSCSITNVY